MLLHKNLRSEETPDLVSNCDMDVIPEQQPEGIQWEEVNQAAVQPPFISDLNSFHCASHIGEKQNKDREFSQKEGTPRFCSLQSNVPAKDDRSHSRLDNLCSSERDCSLSFCTDGVRGQNTFEHIMDSSRICSNDSVDTTMLGNGTEKQSDVGLRLSRDEVQHGKELDITIDFEEGSPVSSQHFRYA